MPTGSEPARTGPISQEAVDTPAAVVDLDQVRSNARRVVTYAREHHLGWRPHVKTHKSLTVGAIQLEEGARGLTVATLREAEVMAALTDDLLLAYPQLGPARRERLARLVAHGVRIKVALDSPEALDQAAAAGREGGGEVEVLVELDVGMGRVGVQGPEEAVALAARATEARGVRYGGILFYPGHIRVPAPEQPPLLEEVSRRLGTVLAALEAGGLAPPVVSGGSTPTLWQSHLTPGLTEIRPGTAIFHDRDMVELGVCATDEVAYHVLATVVSTAVPGRAVVDAGSKALAREEFRAGGKGYGLLPDHPDVPVISLSEEHGVLDISGSSWRPRVGERVRIIPNHVCVSVNLQDRLLAREGQEYRPVPLEGRGRLQAGTEPRHL
jgi:D-serine deaminase-like pyridoxal phosphate-dependent protein